MSTAHFVAIIQSPMTGSDGVTYYTIRVSGAGAAWTTARRYSAFGQLRETLTQYSSFLTPESRVLMPPMPPKSFFRLLLSPSFRQTRQQCLQNVLHAAMQADPDLSKLQALRDFLEVPKQEAAFRSVLQDCTPSAPPAEIVQAAEPAWSHELSGQLGAQARYPLPSAYNHAAGLQYAREVPAQPAYTPPGYVMPATPSINSRQPHWSASTAGGMHHGKAAGFEQGGTVVAERRGCERVAAGPSQELLGPRSEGVMEETGGEVWTA